MAKFYGVIGYVFTEETRPGIWEENCVERMYYGDVLQSRHRFQDSGNVNDDLNISNQISIIVDPFANTNFHAMRYVEFMGAKWKITEVEVKFPRLNLTIGGVYNPYENEEDTDA